MEEQKNGRSHENSESQTRISHLEEQLKSAQEQYRILQQQSSSQIDQLTSSHNQTIQQMNQQLNERMEQQTQQIHLEWNTKYDGLAAERSLAIAKKEEEIRELNDRLKTMGEERSHQSGLIEQMRSTISELMKLAGTSQQQLKEKSEVRADKDGDRDRDRDGYILGSCSRSSGDELTPLYCISFYLFI